MPHRILVLLLAAWTVSAQAAPGFAAGPVFPRGSRIGLEPPGQLVLSRRFNGFEDRAHDVAVTLLDLPPRAYRALEKSAFNKTLKGLIVDKREMFSFRDGIGYLITGHQEIKGTTFRSWYLLANTATHEAGQIAAVIAVRLPKNATRLYPDRVIRAALASVSFRKPPVAELLGLLPFKLTEMAGFRLSKISPQGVVVLVDGPSDDLTNQPYLVISFGRGAPAAANLRPKFARDLLIRLPLAGLTVTAAEPMRIGNRPGFELRATAKGTDGKPIALVQWLRYGGAGTFLRMIGVVAKDRWDALFPRFRAVRDGIDVR